MGGPKLLCAHSVTTITLGCDGSALTDIWKNPEYVKPLAGNHNCLTA